MTKRVAWCAALCLVMALVAAGCATTGGGKSPEEQIKDQVAAWKTAFEAGDVDGVMKSFSEKFEHYDWQDKAGAKEFIAEAKDMGYLDGVTVGTDEMEIKLEGDKATVYPIDISGSFGSVTLELTMAKEAAGWLVVGLDAAGL